MQIGRISVRAVAGLWAGSFFAVAVLLWLSIQFVGLRFTLAAPVRTTLPESAATRVVPPANNAPILDVDEVTRAAERGAFVGRAVRFDGMTARSVSRAGFWIGSDAGSALFVRPVPDLENSVSEGVRVDISGIILSFPDVDRMGREWNMGLRETAQLIPGQIYLWASTIDRK